MPNGDGGDWGQIIAASINATNQNIQTFLARQDATDAAIPTSVTPTQKTGGFMEILGSPSGIILIGGLVLVVVMLAR